MQDSQNVQELVICQSLHVAIRSRNTFKILVWQNIIAHRQKELHLVQFPVLWSILPHLLLQPHKDSDLWDFLCHICQSHRDIQGSPGHQNNTICLCSSNWILFSLVETWHKNFISEILSLPHKKITSLLRTDWVDILGCAKLRSLPKPSISLLICYRTT